jgi:subtilisin family serine protease
LHDVITPADSTATKGTYPGRSKWEFLNGTSMATPHATGVAALAASENLNEEDNSALLNNPVALKQAVLDGGRSIPATDGKATASGKMVDANLALTKADKIPPEISDMPSDITKTATSKDGATVTYSSPTATDKVDGPVNVTCASSPTPDLKSGDTFPLGTTEITCTAKDKTGNKATKKFNVKVVYDYKGFFSPVDNPEVLNKARAGSAIPVKFTLGGDMGLDVFYSEKKDDGTTVSYPRSTIMNCSSADSVDAVEQTLTAGSSSLDYDQVTQQYTYVWKTSKEWAGSCRQLVVKLKDGTEYRAFFQLV